MSLIEELRDKQLAYNEWLRTATPEERALAAKAHLLYIASVEPNSYGYLFADDDED